MAFNSTEYAILFLVAFAGAWLLAERLKARVYFLLAASYFFYASWVPAYLGLIVLSSTLDFFVGREIHKREGAAARKALLATSLLVNLGILCTFKYFNFFAQEFSELMGVFGMAVQPWHLKVLLPVGISFYTFQSLSYTIDIYRKKLEPTEFFVQYLLFVSFFPQLVAGPIVRAKKLLPQLMMPPTLDAKQGGRAIFLIGFGLVKKIAIADFLGGHLVDPVFSNPGMYSSVEALLATYGYAFQIYADFSAYSDIAIGSAALLGFEIPVNFDAPYTAMNLREFWQRWHISLSTWLRDYLYIPMGGNRKGSTRTYFHLAATMLIGGLWHGAALTFVFWGAIHGAALILTRFLQRRGVGKGLPSAAKRSLGVLLTFHVVCAAWIFFRAQSFDGAKEMFQAIFSMDLGTTNVSVPALGVLGVALLTHWIPKEWIEKSKDLFQAAPAPIQALAVICLIVGASQLATTEVSPFIYFQF